MNMKHLLICAAALAVGVAWGYQRGLRVGTTQASAGPVVGTGTDWLAWQQQ